VVPSLPWERGEDVNKKKKKKKNTSKHANEISQANSRSFYICVKGGNLKKEKLNFETSAMHCKKTQKYTRSQEGGHTGD